MPLFHVLLTVLGLGLLAATLPLLIDVLVLSVAALWPPRAPRLGLAERLRLAVIIPAHNEEQLIAACVSSIVTSGGPDIALYAVAHNCTDSTAERAAAAGAGVLILNETSGGGKGVALHHGFTHALAAGADAVLVIDADSTVSPGLASRVAAALEAGSQALQCRYVAAHSGVSSHTRLQALAFRGMNVVRPRGRSRLHLSCGIFGNGFALTASTLRSVPYLASTVVEDLEYHLHLVRAGIRVDFLNSAQVLGEMPDNRDAATTQRARWEGGRLLTRRRFALPLLREVLTGHLRFFEPLLDLLSLPLATEAALLLLALLLPLRWVRFYAADGFAILALYALIAAWLGPHPVRDLKALAFAPFYIFFKLMILPATWRASRKNSAWVRTPRNNGPKP